MALIALFAAQACAPPAAPPPPSLVFKLDCSRTYAALSAELLSLSDLKAAPDTPGEPYRYLTTADGDLAFVLTDPGAPGHPAIFRQAAVRRGGATVMETTGCPYGDPAGFVQVKAYLEGLKTR